MLTVLSLAGHGSAVMRRNTGLSAVARSTPSQSLSFTGHHLCFVQDLVNEDVAMYEMQLGQYLHKILERNSPLAVDRLAIGDVRSTITGSLVSAVHVQYCNFRDSHQSLD